MEFESNTMLSAGRCRVCDSGEVGLLQCGQCLKIVLFCDECDATWTTPDMQEEPIFPAPVEFPCPACDFPLFDPPSHWATIEEAILVDWIADAVAEGSLKLEPFEIVLPADTSDASTNGHVVKKDIEELFEWEYEDDDDDDYEDDEYDDEDELDDDDYEDDSDLELE